MYLDNVYIDIEINDTAYECLMIISLKKLYTKNQCIV